MSCCSSLGDLELEEVKGFMDLGFVFKKQNLSSHVISLIPGLQRINSQEQDLGTQIEEEKRGPYLSDSWLVKMPDSPLIRLRISRVCNDSEKVKEHLKDWARTVAAAIHQESWLMVGVLSRLLWMLRLMKYTRDLVLVNLYEYSYCVYMCFEILPPSH